MAKRGSRKHSVVFFRCFSVSDSVSVIVSSCSESTENQTARRSSDYFFFGLCDRRLCCSSSCRQTLDIMSERFGGRSLE